MITTRSGGASAINRRDVLGGVAGLLGATMIGPRTAAAAGEDGLDALARRKGLRFGCAVRRAHLDASPELRAAILREAGLLVAENELKWRPLEPEPGTLDFGSAERIVDFATENGLAMRGHTLAWHQNPPVWAIDLLKGAAGAELLLGHVEAVATRLKGRIAEWDVVNEAVLPKDGRQNALRAWPLYDTYGYDLLADCFKTARAADPGAVLYYNDYGIEYGRFEDQEKRLGVLRLIEALKTRGAPIQGLGIQSHLGLGYRFNPTVFRQFLAEVASLEVAIKLTEFDVADFRLEGPVALRDSMVAGDAKVFLDTAFDEKAVNGLLTWGISNRYSWLNEMKLRKDGELQRCLPLDENFERTPLWHVIAKAFDDAPDRR